MSNIVFLNLTEEICSLIQEAREYTQQGDYGNAIAMLSAITESSVENWDLVDEYGVDYYEVANQLSRVWCETILKGDLDEAEKVDLQVNLEYWRDGWGECFDPVIAALSQGWSDPALKQVLQGNISPAGIWSGEIPYYAEDLAAIRLDILEQQGRFEEYLYLAQVLCCIYFNAPLIAAFSSSSSSARCLYSAKGILPSLY